MDKKLYSVNCVFDIKQKALEISFEIEADPVAIKILEDLGKEKEFKDYIVNQSNIYKRIANELNETTCKFIKETLTNIDGDNEMQIAVVKSLIQMLKAVIDDED